MAFTVLSDSDVKGLLQSLDKSDVLHMTEVLNDAFWSYSSGNESKYQLHRQAVTRPSGQSALFMPATLPDGLSVKVVSLPPPRPPANEESNLSKPTLRVVLTICDSTGKGIGVINAEEFTAFRTSLGSMLLYQDRRRTENIVLFGAGKQALYHLRLALMLRGPDIQSITIVNRSQLRAQWLIDRLHQMDHDGHNTSAAHVQFSVLESRSSGSDYETRLQSAIQQADVIFCTTPSTEALFPAAWLTSDHGRRKKRYVSAIGSYKLDMKEIDPDLLQAITNTVLGTYIPDLQHQATGGVIAVDSREACFLEAGEIVEAKVLPEKIVEIGELFNIRRMADQSGQDRLSEWIKDGLVVYKSVGVGIMDLVLGKALIDLARERNVGFRLQDF